MATHANLSQYEMHLSVYNCIWRMIRNAFVSVQLHIADDRKCICQCTFAYGRWQEMRLSMHSCIHRVTRIAFVSVQLHMAGHKKCIC